LIEEITIKNLEQIKVVLWVYEYFGMFSSSIRAKHLYGGNGQKWKMVVLTLRVRVMWMKCVSDLDFKSMAGLS